VKLLSKAQEFLTQRSVQPTPITRDGVFSFNEKTQYASSASHGARSALEAGYQLAPLNFFICEIRAIRVKRFSGLSSLGSEYV
jgi:hypothetical protein